MFKRAKICRQILPALLRINAKPSQSANIENTLLAASIEGTGGDYRTLALLVDWLDLHLARVNVESVDTTCLSLSRMTEYARFGLPLPIGNKRTGG